MFCFVLSHCQTITCISICSKSLYSSRAWGIILLLLLTKELGRHRGREGKTECSLCGDECENVSHVLWECSAYSSTRACFIKKLQELLENEYEDFESLDKVEKSSYVLGSELWENKFDGLLSLVKEYITDVWEIRKHKLYDSDSGPGQQTTVKKCLCIIIT